MIHGPWQTKNYFCDDVFKTWTWERSMGHDKQKYYGDDVFGPQSSLRHCTLVEISQQIILSAHPIQKGGTGMLLSIKILISWSRLEDFGLELKRDAVNYIIEFVYRGEVDILGEKLTDFCAAAHTLGVLGKMNRSDWTWDETRTRNKSTRHSAIHTHNTHTRTLLSLYRRMICITVILARNRSISQSNIVFFSPGFSGLEHLPVPAAPQRPPCLSNQSIRYHSLQVWSTSRCRRPHNGRPVWARNTSRLQTKVSCAGKPLPWPRLLPSTTFR